MFRVFARILLCALVLQTAFFEANAGRDKQTQTDTTDNSGKIRQNLKTIYNLLQESWKELFKNIMEVFGQSTLDIPDMGRSYTAAAETTASPAATADWCDNGKGIISDGGCYWIERLSRQRQITYEKAKDLCKKSRPAQPAEFYNEKQYNDLMTYIRSKIPVGFIGYYSVWTRMTYDTETSTVYISHGQEAPFVDWNVQTIDMKDWTQIRLDVNKLDYWKGGMSNRDPTSKSYAVICEFIYLT